MKIIGVTGPSGSGKTLLTEYFSSLGISTIDADALYHSMLVPPSHCLDLIREKFGDSVFFDDGSLNRAALSEIVFRSPEKLELLNRTVLGTVIQEIRRIISELDQKGETVVIVDAPTLIESGFNQECDTVISVISSPEIRVKRISERDGISLQKAEARVSAQRDDEFYKNASNHVLYNNATTEDFLKSVIMLAEELGYKSNK